MTLLSLFLDEQSKDNGGINHGNRNNYFVQYLFKIENNSNTMIDMVIQVNRKLDLR